MRIEGSELNPGANASGSGGAPPARSRQQRRTGGATSRNNDDKLMDALEHAVLNILKDAETTPEQRNAAIANGVRVLALRHRIHGGRDSEDFFG